VSGLNRTEPWEILRHSEKNSILRSWPVSMKQRILLPRDLAMSEQDIPVSEGVIVDAQYRRLKACSHLSFTTTEHPDGTELESWTFEAKVIHSVSISRPKWQLSGPTLLQIRGLDGQNSDVNFWKRYCWWTLPVAKLRNRWLSSEFQFHFEPREDL